MRALDDRPRVVDRPTQADALIEEARQRHHRRRRWTAATAALLAIGGTVTGLGLAGGNHPPAPASSGSNKSPHTSLPIQDRSFLQAGVTPALAVESGLLAGNEGWNADGLDLYLSTDDGSRWSTITPPNLEGEDPVGHLLQVTSWGHSDIAISVAENYFGGVEVSTDDGRTWLRRTLPGASLAMLSANTILAVSGQGDSASSSPAITTFLTSDGGHAWHLVGSQPLSKTEAVGASIGQTTFSSVSDGWVGVTQEWKGDGTIARTTDGGRHWKLATLPPPVGTHLVVFDIGQPYVDGNQLLVAAGVAVPSEPGARQEQLALYSSNNGGVTWTGKLLSGSKSHAGSGIGLSGALSILSTADWVKQYDDGIAITTDGGTHWTTRKVTGAWSHGPVIVESVDFETLEHGWANVSYDSCANGLTLPNGDCNASGLARTDDGGKTWTLIIKGLVR
jgi:hypothetical protein